ncbi:Uncharacterised protein [Salmonella enterica subsp. enterica serovar Bovismorbificans]|uniref:Uncharacterized protein n=1 Tax=Salmonella enterica subsp. enterica serovar Bovismorbificans TaxID=58097 RepID=A0A655E828_SALET|nr:Uncharacterised protein [Salmonella enterica subsp. enterica serovar Bovismorbificans]CNV13338.1 Uncharacterised protein [Salmonella enterica subsp. enterica serovar Bovismorbificans]
MINTCASNFGRLLINAVESSNSPTTFTHSICSSDLRIPNSTIGWSSAIITFILFMYWATLLQQAFDVGVNVADIFFYTWSIFLTNQMFQRFT